MLRASMFALLGGVLILSGGVVGQDAKKKDEPTVKVKGMLPANWSKIGLTDPQRQEIYKIQGKYGEEINKLEAKIKELKSARDKDMKAVLTADQKKRLEDVLTGKAK
jgi:hypothetical protein